MSFWHSHWGHRIQAEITLDRDSCVMTARGSVAQTVLCADRSVRVDTFDLYTPTGRTELPSEIVRFISGWRATQHVQGTIRRSVPRQTIAQLCMAVFVQKKT